ncbi:hypothetical protein RND71_022305 [Anisodus tanguticus]|uniref:Rho GDP-dissociation inhibitor 1-like n=1 Tax=Anisodus tanguticus TaxID=243964 RepID=A0AAE1RYC1_9SOLA|nr:hypothetical protein RND71_022305 [Anisodus tanguticus]
MSLAVGVAESSNNMGFDENKVTICEGNKGIMADHSDPEIENGGPVGENNKVNRQMSENSIYTTDQEEDDDEANNKIELGPQCSLKQQFEKDKDDESLRRWKEQLLGSVDINAVGESLDPEVKILSLEIKSLGRSDIVLPIPKDGNPKSPWFVLKEGSKYSLKFTFQVNNNIVTGLKYTNTVWKTGIKVDSTKQMIGAFSPQLEPYTHEMPEDTTPFGIFARGSYSARTKFLDDDNKCYLEINYTFEIKKEWQEK